MDASVMDLRERVAADCDAARLLESSNDPRGHSKVGAMAVMTIDISTDSDVFRAYVERVLVPSLRSGDVVAIDDPPAHHSPAIAERIDEPGAELIYVPP